MDEATSGSTVNAAPSATSPKPRICIVGNSNSIMKDGYSEILTRTGSYDIENLSIGGTPNVLLAAVLADRRLYQADYVIIETCVLDQHYGSSGTYSRECGQEALELFITEVRSRSKAHLIILMIPTRFGLMEPLKQWAEGLYRETAARFCVPLLDGYALFRDLLGRRQALRGPVALDHALRLMDALGLPPQPGALYAAHYAIGWSTLRDPNQRGNALAWFGFSDNLHLSTRMHRLFGEMLHSYIESAPNRGGLRPQQPTVPVVENVLPQTPGRTVERTSRLISRRLAVVEPDQPVQYKCGPAWKAIGLLINDKETTGQLQIQSAQGQETVTTMRTVHPSAWIARIVSLTGQVGDGDITVRIAPRAQTSADGTCSGEVGELTLLRRDWRQLRQLDMVLQPPDRVRIDEAPASRALIAHAVAEAEDLTQVINAGAFIPAELIAILPLLGTLGGVDDTHLTVARTLLLTQDLNRLRAFLSSGPDSDRITRLRQVLNDTFDKRPDDAATHLEAIRSLRNAGRLAEAAAACTEAAGLFASDVRFPIERAFIARSANDIQLAASTWQAIRENFPAVNAGYIGEANIRLELGERAECLAIIRTGTERFPNDMLIWSAAARLEAQCGELDVSFRRWAQIREKFPTDPGGWLGEARIRREAQQPIAAAALLQDALRQWPDHVELQRELARVAPTPAQ